ncbi:hypothetical protein Q1695_009679 [Nippostrongylus brasiliensis]|nr:hypothetical protein Q1695_009679 [Nippostrongylus brasiliensis]
MEGERLNEVIAGAIMFLVGVVGSLVNIFAVVLIYRTPTFHNAFGVICASHLLADVGVLAICALWAGPATFFNFSSSTTHSYFGERLGQVIMFFWYASIYCQLQIAINRLVAISLPMLYNWAFSTRRTAQVLAGFWLLSFAHVIIYFWDGCSFTFEVESFNWNYAETSCGAIISFYLDFLHGTVLCVTVIVVDTITFFVIFKKAKMLGRSNSTMQERSMLWRNIHFYLQGCLQAGCFVLMITSFHILSKLTKTKWQTFLTTTFVWELMHAMDGVVIFIFHERFRVVLLHPGLLFRRNTRATSTSAVKPIH